MRLTEKSNQGYIYQVPCPDGLGFMTYSEHPIQKLGQYEDIDENPEHLAKIKKALETIKELVNSFDDLPCGKYVQEQVIEIIKNYLKEHLKQEEQDLLIEVLS